MLQRINTPAPRGRTGQSRLKRFEANPETRFVQLAEANPRHPRESRAKWERRLRDVVDRELFADARYAEPLNEYIYTNFLRNYMASVAEPSAKSVPVEKKPPARKTVLAPDEKRRIEAEAEAALERKQDYRASLKVLQLVMPNGKQLQFNTFNEVGEFGAFYAAIMNSVPKSQRDKMVGELLTEDAAKALLNQHAPVR